MNLEEFKKAIAQAREKKKLILGTDRTLKLLKTSKVKLVATANNSPFYEEVNHHTKLAGVEFYPFPGSGLDLGELCKKPFAVSTLAVVS